MKVSTKAIVSLMQNAKQSVKFKLLTVMAIMLFNSMHTSLNAQTAVKHFNLVAEKPVSVLNERAKINFTREFKNITGEKWVKKNDGYRAKFDNSGINYMVDYNRKGNWLSTIKNYDEPNIDSRVADAVRTAFPGYSIVHLAEIKKGKATVYLVKIENQKVLKTIRMADGEMDVYEAYTKG
jgi:hypothetical protein